MGAVDVAGDVGQTYRRSGVTWGFYFYSYFYYIVIWI